MAARPPSSASFTRAGTDDVHRAEQDAQRIRSQGGIHLLQAASQPARAHAGHIARLLGSLVVVESAWGLRCASDPAEAVRAALRDAVALELRRLAKVFAGRIKRMDRPGEPEGVPATRLELELETNEDTRTLHLEGAWAWNLHASGARVGDIVQIGMQDPWITIHDDPHILEDHVLDEREHRLRIPLGALDRAHAMKDVQPPDDEPAKGEEALLVDAVRTSDRLLATGERTSPGPDARGSSDRWLRQRLGEKNARLAPGVLLILDAARMPVEAVSAVHAGQGAYAAPGLLLCESTQERFEELCQAFPDGDRLDPLS